jgi:hypothetical protein
MGVAAKLCKYRVFFFLPAGGLSIGERHLAAGNIAQAVPFQYEINRLSLINSPEGKVSHSPGGVIYNASRYQGCDESQHS